jgi:transposase
MTSKRRKHSAAFKARVALEAVIGIKTVSEISSQYELHPTQVSQWKKELVERSAEVFAKGNSRKAEEEIEAMKRRHHAKIGQLVLDVDFLKKKCAELRIPLDGEQ